MANVSAFTGAFPVIPGGTVELGYSQITSNVGVSGTTAGSPTVIVSDLTFVSDGGPLLIEFSAPYAALTTSGSGSVTFGFWIDGAQYSQPSGVYEGQTGTISVPVHAKQRVTLSAGSHTVRVVAYRSGTAATVYAGSGTTGADAPAFLRVSKIVNQNDGLKPFWTPPIVTALPANPQYGDVVTYKHAGAGNIGAALPMQYDGTKWLPLGEAIVARWASGGGQTFSSTTPTAVNVGTYNTQTFTPPWNGWYEISARVEHATLTTGIGMYYALRSTDGAHNVTLNYVADANGYTYHTNFGFPNPVSAVLSSAKTYRFYGWITYPFGNTGYMNFASAHIRACAAA